jgi:hypothetical protein
MGCMQYRKSRLEDWKMLKKAIIIASLVLALGSIGVAYQTGFAQAQECCGGGEKPSGGDRP